MKLSEALKITPKPVKIGTQQGSGFLFVGQPKDALKSLKAVPRHEGSPRWEDRKVLESYNSALVIDSTRIIIIEGKEKLVADTMEANGIEVVDISGQGEWRSVTGVYKG